MGNHFIGHISFSDARERLLAASRFWTVTDNHEDKSLRAQFSTNGEAWHGVVLYYNRSVEESVKIENSPHPIVYVALELTIGSILEDLYGSGRPWYRLTYRIGEAEYQAMVAEIKEHLETWIEPNPSYLTQAEIREIESRAEQLFALHGQGTPRTESINDLFFGEARAALEAERDDPSLVWADRLARGLSSDRSDHFQRLMVEARTAEAEREASLPLDPIDFLELLRRI